MMSPALQNPRQRLGLAAAVLAAIALGAGESRSQGPEGGGVEPVASNEGVESSTGAPQAAARIAKPYAHRFPNMVLKSHEGKHVRFYDDLLEGKVVLINFMYATCDGR